ncbi:hypothetical protein DFJ73DRAFT_871396 [Zopfochytrium polystomum]|nr:hypothetical protein DFJ73DRAFT_871396 [Zopfochytrium polystomum]
MHVEWCVSRLCNLVLISGAPVAFDFSWTERCGALKGVWTTFHTLDLHVDKKLVLGQISLWWIDQKKFTRPFLSYEGCLDL